MTQRFGPSLNGRGATFRVWAPAQRTVALVLNDGREMSMTREDQGFFRLDVPGVTAGQRYWFRTRQGLRPDPASRYQPEGPLGFSEIVDGASFPWTDDAWRGVTADHQHVFYEMHIGTFTREGTWAAATERLPRLVDVGVTTLEVMPIAEFAGRFGWGYDGVQLFAPTRLYGTPDAARRFVDRAHSLGLAVILDVVYNHFGPVGNFLPELSTTVHGKPGEWGDSLNYDGEGSGPVREFVKENAAYWTREFHFDGLRLDAVSAIHDSTSEHIVSEICRAARDGGTGRHVFVVGECETQDARLIKGGPFTDGLDAMWSEDWHHSAVVALTGQREAYFTDYLGTAHELAAMARHGFLYQGQWYGWQKQMRGSSTLGLPGSRFVAFLENHDQVANTGLGDRLYTRVDAARWRAMTAALLLGPALPLLFQGQEYGSTRPFLYFADHEGELAEAVARGRLDFLSQFPSLSTPRMRAVMPRPGDPATFERCRLSDEERNAETPLRRLHRDLLRLRREDEVLREVGSNRVGVESSAPASGVLLLRYVTPAAHRLLVVNLADDYHCPMNDPLLAPFAGARWQLLWSSEQPQYGGRDLMFIPDAGRWLVSGGTAMLLATSAM